MWIILTAQMREEIYYLLEYRRLLPKWQKRCRQGTRETNDLQHMIDTSLRRLNKAENVAIASIDNKKVYDMVQQTW